MLILDRFAFCKKDLTAFCLSKLTPGTGASAFEAKETVANDAEETINSAAEINFFIDINLVTHVLQNNTVFCELFRSLVAG